VELTTVGGCELVGLLRFGGEYCWPMFAPTGGEEEEEDDEEMMELGDRVTEGMASLEPYGGGGGCIAVDSAVYIVPPNVWISVLVLVPFM